MDGDPPPELNVTRRMPCPETARTTGPPRIPWSQPNPREPTHMDYRITGLSPEPFEPLFGLSYA